MDQDILKQIGFLDAEIIIYKALLRKGESKVSDLNKETGIHRTHIYDILEKLREKGLVSIYIKSNKKYFKAYSPTKILDYIDERKEKVKHILPNSQQLANETKDDVSIELFKGLEGLKTVLQDIINTKKDYCAMGNIKSFETEFEFLIQNFLKNVIKNRIMERIICDKKEAIEKIKYGRYRYLNGEYIFPSNFWVYGDKVAIFILNRPYYAILISNKDIAKTYQNYFEFFWKLAKR
jgi:HTH-type transcriptional regulator, sugar sensing transcriptional regulator